MRKYYALLGVLFLAALLRLALGVWTPPAPPHDSSLDDRPPIIVRGLDD